MADQQALINALQNLVAAMAANNNNIPAPTAPVLILDPFNTPLPFILELVPDHLLGAKLAPP